MTAELKLGEMSGPATLKIFNDNVPLANSLGIDWAKVHTSGWANKSRGAALTATLLADIAEAQRPKAEVEAEHAAEADAIIAGVAKRSRAKKIGLPSLNAVTPAERRSRKATEAAKLEIAATDGIRFAEVTRKPDGATTVEEFVAKGGKVTRGKTRSARGRKGGLKIAPVEA